MYFLAAWAVGFAVAAQAVSAPDPTTFSAPNGVRIPGVRPDFGLSFPRELAAEMDHSPPSVSYTSEVSRRPSNRRVVAVYQIRPTRYVARSLSTFGPHPLRPLWADSQSCPAMIERLKVLDDFTFSLNAPTGMTSHSLSLVADGFDIVIRAQGRVSAGQWIGATISGNIGPVADWAEAMNLAIDPCLSLNEPADLPPISYPQTLRPPHLVTPAEPPPPPGGPQ